MASITIAIILNEDEQEVVAYKAGADWLYTKVARALATKAEDAERRRHLVHDSNLEEIVAQYEDPAGEGLDGDTELALFRFLKFERPAMWRLWVRMYPARVAQLSLRGDLKEDGV